MQIKNKQTDCESQPCCIYARYSSHSQRDVSIEQQVSECEAFCRMNNLRVVEVYADRHLSGTNDKRPQFQKMLRDAERHRWSYVVTWKVDRFARNRYDSATYKYRLKRHGVRVLYAKESIPDGPEGILLESVLEGSAEYYSANLSQNIKRGLHYNAMERKVNNGSMPFGYCKGEDGRFAILDGEAEVVREIFRKVAEGVPYVEITEDLNRRGILTKRGNRWGKNSLRTMLSNETYVGVYKFGSVRIEDGAPAIIDRALFLQVQTLVQKKKAVHGRRRENGEYLLTGKLRCGLCDGFMTGISGTGRNGELRYYYACHTKRTEHTCKKGNVSRDWLEGVVVQAAVEHVLRPEVIQWVADCCVAYQKREAAGSQLALLNARRSETKKALDNVMKAIEAGIITATTKERLMELEAELSRIDDSIALEKASLVRLDRDEVIYTLERFCHGDSSDRDYRRKIIDAFVAMVCLWDDRIRIGFNWSAPLNEIDVKLVSEAEDFVVVDNGSYKGCSSPAQ